MKRPIAIIFYTASVLQWSSQSATAFGVGPSLLQDSISNLVSSAAVINLQQAASGIFEKYMSTLGSNPLPTKMLTGAALAAAGDAIAQGRDDDDYNAARGASFAAFDMTYRGAQHYLFPIIVEFCRGQYLLSIMAAVGATKLFDASSLTAMERALANQLIIVPLMYYPVFFTFTGAMQGLTFIEGLERAKENFIPLMKRNLLFWIPVQYVQFCYVPTDLQIPFLSVAGLGWTFILSAMAGSAKKYSNDDPEHETYCVIGTEEGCVIPEEELFPNAFDDFDENVSSLEELNVSEVPSLGENNETLSKEKNREVVVE
mmetsp:Transcript_36103/g.66177  ORF Transcript_36103/g.66177 Transcript_36103/m.66177 type:complete len:315 (+) Transcript_36103:127-1071(+)|eukprot:CAMPEP_0201884780 /NCGR_PEP_ID=MMETSP0902-20130614/17550_1 /ASSEMBLY_ACC=CAM_ASM_000551 /TAXON_ID=420261 /ORGANISM="Thalassiosira antarctica, Strain CCMP982" /LENGTH=314 /DNA_ID=CAMNT_0048413789 /DNA_START=45 /DNA_END=989 /DNA_ORIENTATION=+